MFWTISTPFLTSARSNSKFYLPDSGGNWEPRTRPSNFSGLKLNILIFLKNVTFHFFIWQGFFLGLPLRTGWERWWALRQARHGRYFLTQILDASLIHPETEILDTRIKTGYQALSYQSMDKMWICRATPHKNLIKYRQTTPSCLPACEKF